MSPRSLLDLAAILAAAADVLKSTRGPEAARLLGLMRQTVDGLETAAARLDAASAQDPALDAEVLARWRHDLVAPITAMVGWARLFSEARDPTARIRTSEAIERNATQLGQLLTEPLGPGADVMLAEGLLRFLVAHDEPYCRDCLSEEAGVNRGELDAQLLELAAEGSVSVRQGTCAKCGESRLLLRRWLA